MWCPKCRNEYINGVTTCVDCGCDLVEELPEEIDENEPVAIGSLAKEETAAKLVSYLNRAGLLSCAVRPQPENEEGEIPAYDIIVAGKELVYIHQLFDGLTEDADDDENPDLELLLPKFEEKYAEIQDEEANKLLSDLRTEASTVYVNKKDIYSDFKFSGISFIVFAVLGYLFALLNGLGVLTIFNTFSVVVLTIVFTIFMIIGISSIHKANTIKTLVSEEENVLEDVENYIAEHFTDDYFASLPSDESLSDEENFLMITDRLKVELTEAFPLFSRGYIDQLVDDRYGEYLDSKESEEPEKTSEDENVEE